MKAVSVLLLLSALSGCSNRIEEPSAPHEAEQRVEITSEIAIDYHFSLPKRSESSVHQLALLIASALRTDVTSANLKLVSADEPGNYLGVIEGEHPVRLDYTTKTDTFSMLDVDLASVRDGIELTEEQARIRLSEVIAKLTSNGAVPEGVYHAERAVSKTLLMGSGSSTGARTQGVKEYRFFIARKVDGIVVSDDTQTDLGLHVAIHRSGLVRAIRVSAAGLTYDISGQQLARTILPSAFTDNVNGRYPGALIVSKSLRYVLSSEPQVAGLRQVFQVSEPIQSNGVIVGHSRWLTVFYPFADVNAEPYIWPTPTPNDTGDSK